MSTNYIENKIKELSVRIEELSNQLTGLSAIDERGRIKVDSKTQKISKKDRKLYLFFDFIDFFITKYKLLHPFVH